MDRIPTLERWRSRLPHWEVDGHWHFVTIRCSGTLPTNVKQNLSDIHKSLESIHPQNDEFRILQRKYFLTIEKYLDAGSGFTPFKNAAACNACLQAFQKMDEEGWAVGEVTIMPNHVHLLIRRGESPYSLKVILRRFKGRSARWCNETLGRSGKFWQQDWFDRWMRHEGELLKTIGYIRSNPIKAKLCKAWEDHKWRVSRL